MKKQQSLFKNKITNINLTILILGLFTSLIFISSNNKILALDLNSDLKNQLLEMDTPPLPSLENVDSYLPSPAAIHNVQVIIRLKERRVYVYQQDKVIASFPIAVGKKGWETPQGNFSIIQMIQAPSWQNPWTGKVIPPGQNNPLGDRWIGFWTDGKNTIGFHGTPGEHLIGQAVSHGCVRMRNKDVRALFELVTMGTPVIVKP